MNKKGLDGITDVIVSFVVGVIFAVGLLYSGMTRRSKVLGFLTLDANWDPSLMFVMAGAVLGNLLTFNYVMKIRGKPVLAKELDLPKATGVDAKLVLGAALFGLGRGLGGVCPGPALIVTPVYLPYMLIYFVPTMAVGQFIGGLFEKTEEKSKTKSG